MGRTKYFAGALGVGLGIYMIGLLIVLVVDNATIRDTYAEYMGLIWFAMSISSYPLVKKILA